MANTDYTEAAFWADIKGAIRSVAVALERYGRATNSRMCLRLSKMFNAAANVIDLGFM
jgi:hypothetical protein